MYDFDAGDISLDFANTNNWHASAAPQDFLHNFMDLIQWGQQAGLVTEEKANELGLFSQGQPEESCKGPLLSPSSCGNPFTASFPTCMRAGLLLISICPYLIQWRVKPWRIYSSPRWVVNIAGNFHPTSRRPT